MRIHVIRTGSVRVKRSFLFPRAGLRRQLSLFLPDQWSEPLPILCWAIEHEDRLLLVDTGESSKVRDIPFARFDVSVEQELPGALAAAGLSVGDVSEVILTHHHGDHVDGLPHVRAPVWIHSEELAFARSPFSAVMRRVLRQPLPSGFSPQAFDLDGAPFGAFQGSRSFTADGRIVAVPTPGHTPGHVSVVCIDDEGRHVMLAGDVTDTLEQLQARRADAIGPDPAVHVATLQRIGRHCAEHPTVFLPSHDPESEQRLAGMVTVMPRAGLEPAPPD